MHECRVSSVRSVDITVRDVEAAERFFVDAWGLERCAFQEGVVYLRATGTSFHAISLREARQSALVRIVLGAANRKHVDELWQRVQASGQPTDGPPRELKWPGGGYGFGLRDPEGRSFAVLSNAADHAGSQTSIDQPKKISHVNINCRDNDATYEFFRDALGFKLSDQTKKFRFLRCNEDHHSMVLGFGSNADLNHIAFELADLESVMRGIGRMRDHGHAVEWGPGRHGPGNNVFAYFCGPEDFPIEYTSEMQAVDEGHHVRSADEWKWPSGRLDHWGVMPGPSRRVEEAGSLFPFSPDGYRLESE